MFQYQALWVDGSDLTNYFENGEIDRLYLNFSDPGPRNAMKTALDLQIFLDTFKQILPEHGEIHFKTDNRGLFEYSLVSFLNTAMKPKWRLSWICTRGDFENNVMTEYEQNSPTKVKSSIGLRQSF